jgi:hypothetical protein
MYSQVVYCLERVPAVVKAEAIKSSLNIDKQEELQKILG